MNNIDKTLEVFMRTINHDIKSLLTGIDAYIQLLEKQAVKESNYTMLKYSNNTEKQIRKLTKYVSDVFDVVKIQNNTLSLQKERTDIKRLFEEIIGMQEALTEKIIRLKIEGEAFFCNIDIGRIHQVMIILLQYICTNPQASKEIFITLSRGKNSLVSTIKNNNVYIEKINKDYFDFFPDNSEKFDINKMPFFIVFGIIYKHGGVFTIKSNRKTGTIFAFTLPITTIL